MWIEDPNIYENHKTKNVRNWDATNMNEEQKSIPKRTEKQLYTYPKIGTWSCMISGRVSGRGPVKTDPFAQESWEGPEPNISARGPKAPRRVKMCFAEAC